MTRGLEWTGKSQYAQKPLQEWTIDGRRVGLARSEGPLTFITVYGAGHMVSFTLLTTLGISIDGMISF